MKCFVIMPFGNPKLEKEKTDKFERIYSHWIKPTIESIRINAKADNFISCHRADKENRPGEIITHIIENLATSDIVIADLTGRNPNVFYELGVRHAIRNTTILISEDIEDIPFDLRGLRTIHYRYHIEGIWDFQQALKDTVLKIISEPEQIDNPVRSFLYKREMEKLLLTPTPPGFDVLKNFMSEMEHIKRELVDQVKETRNIMKLITTPNKDDTEISKNGKINLKFFEGKWVKIFPNGHYYFKVINEKLYAPYCYTGDTHLDSHFYNFRLVNDVLFARFKWFEGSTSGYIFFRVQTPDELKGGWWDDFSLPNYIKQDITKIDDSFPGMVKIILKREKGKIIFPIWVKKYFANINNYITSDE